MAHCRRPLLLPHVNTRIEALFFVATTTLPPRETGHCRRKSESRRRDGTQRANGKLRDAAICRIPILELVSRAYPPRLMPTLMLVRKHRSFGISARAL
jgi:hypothetical protein